MKEDNSSSVSNQTSQFTDEIGNVEKKDEEPMPSLAKLLSLAQREYYMLALAVFLMVIAEATTLVTPLLLAKAYDALVDEDMDIEERKDEINLIMKVALALHAVGVVAGFSRGCILSVAGERLVARLRCNLYAALLRQDIAFFDEQGSGELTSRLGADSTLIQTGASSAMPEVVLGMTKVIVACVLMFWISARLAGTSIAMLACIFISLSPISKLLAYQSKLYQGVLGDAQTYSTEALGSMRTVQSFTAQDREHHRYVRKIGNPDDFPYWIPNFPKDPDEKTTYSIGFNKAIVTSLFYTLLFGVGFGCLYCTLWLGFMLVNDGTISLGELTAFQSYMFTIGSSIAQSANFLTQMITAQGSSARVFSLMEREPTIPAPDDPKSPRKLKKCKGEIGFENVNFAYPSRPDLHVLKKFSLNISKNQTCAFVGASGSGKSTLVALLLRFYDVTGGRVTLDGHDIRELDLHWLRSQMGFVQQEPHLFGMTIRENITYGVQRSVTQEEIKKACTKAHAHDFISSWPEKYETIVGERGVKLSGGQKQRIAIARALLVNPTILLLDEATSALDAESEHLVQKAIDEAVIGRTVVIVAHRLSTIRGADQIVVIDKQNMVDAGTHEELMERCPQYQELIHRQSASNKNEILPPPK